MVYAASWDGRPVEVFAARPESPESRALGLSATNLLGVSATGEMALSLGCHLDMFSSRGTLAPSSLSRASRRRMAQEP